MAATDDEKPVRSPLRLGWYGVLRCARTLDLLEELACAFPSELQIVSAGQPALTQVPDFYERIEALDNFCYAGPYKAPEDLAALYADVDLVWAGDFYQAGYNSKWLLPNRLYEGGYYGVPAIAPAESETGNWIAKREVGFVVPEPIESSLRYLMDNLIENKTSITDLRENFRTSFGCDGERIDGLSNGR